jgi:cellulose synthase/poly-beta-1,6-N-acetylglucosamine synthase-like glycosyltransferase
MNALLVIGLGLIVYTYVGFPLLLMVRGRFTARPVKREPITPRVSIVIVAHNEADTIASKLENVDVLDYPSEQIEVIVASDGSDDGTNERVAAVQRPGLRLLELPRSGKIPALNAAVLHATGDILVFSDANSMYAPDALRELVAPFADPTVGAVGGNQRYASDGGEHMASFGERIYWSYDRKLKSLQSRIGSMTAATGAIHAIRRELFRPVPLGVSDDFMTSTRAIRSGYRLAFAENAIAYESVAGTERAEFSRKVRIATRGLRGIWLARELLNPLRYGFYSLQLLSHKVLRWSVCWLLLVVFVSSVASYGDGAAYRWLVHAQLILYACALFGWALRHSSLSRFKAHKAFGIPFYFCLANYAALRAWMQVLAGKRVDRWDSLRQHPAGI